MKMAALTKRAVNVIMLGRMGYIPAYDIQSRYARQHLDEMAGKPNATGEDTLLLVEHTPVYTVGVRNKNYTQDDVKHLKAIGAQFYTTNRGGLITFHGPGQLVAYPILNLTHFNRSMKWYVCQLEKTLIESLNYFGLEGKRTDQTGVWVDNKKIASIGVHGSRYVTTHGIALNCNTDLSWFKAIDPCGLKGVEMTSVTKELDCNVSMEEATLPFLRAFQNTFNCDLEYRMLENQDLDKLDASSTTHKHTNPTNRHNMTTDSSTSITKHDQKLEIGVRQISTLSSSALSSSPLSASLSTPNSSSSMFSSSNSSASHSSDHNQQSSLPWQAMRRFGPMW